MKHCLITLLFLANSCLGQVDESVPLKKETGSEILYVSVTLNEVITLPMILDTGCSTTTIPAHVAYTLVDTKTLGPADLMGRSKFQLADGTVVENEKIRLHTLRIGTHTFKDVTVCVSKSGAPLLLGGDILSQLETIELDYKNNILKIK